MERTLPENSQITLCPDGKYRWAYEFDLYRNPTILLMLFKIFGIIIAAGLVLFFGELTFDMIRGYADTEDLIGAITGALTFCVGWVVLVTVSYYIYAAIQGGKYCVMFEMDGEGVVHCQYEKQVEKAQVLGLINVLAGVASGNPTQAGVGINSAVNTEMVSSFAEVKSIKGYKRRGVVKVNETLEKNQVYADGADYDFVFEYICEHCPNATVKP